MSDRDLLDAYRNGDVRAFEALLARYEGALVRYALRVLPARGGSREEARDVVQETFLRLIRETKPIDDVGSWLYRVARNVAIDASRKEIHMERRARLAAGLEAGAHRGAPPGVPAAPGGDGTAPPPTLEVEREETEGIVADRLWGLPPKQRDVLILRVQEGKSYREISEITGLTASNVGYLIHHGLKSLAAELRKAGVV